MNIKKALEENRNANQRSGQSAHINNIKDLIPS